ncbi:MAG: ribokinase [Firmicutes bacterium]|nr:ribokinase [Bacillota bacterium]
MDLVAQVAQAPRAGETVMARAFSRHSGGKGANQAVAAARWGGRARLVACVGEDSFGDALMTELDTYGVDLQDVRRVDQPTGTALIVVEEGGENRIVIFPGANHALSAEDAQAMVAQMQPDDVLLAPLEVPLDAVCAAFAAAHARNVFTILNPAPALSLPDQLWHAIDLLTPNEHELSALTGLATDTEEGLQAAAEHLLARGPSFVAVTCGSSGVRLYAREAAPIVVNAPRLDAVDTTGAGDTWNGCLAAQLEAGVALQEAVQVATLAASLSCTRPGTMQAVPTPEEVQQWRTRHGLTGLVGGGK